MNLNGVDAEIVSAPARIGRVKVWGSGRAAAALWLAPKKRTPERLDSLARGALIGCSGTLEEDGSFGTEHGPRFVIKAVHDGGPSDISQAEIAELM